MAKTRKTYTAEFELQAVRMVTDQHLAAASASPKAVSANGSRRSAPTERTPSPVTDGSPRTTRNCTASAPRSSA